MHLFVGPTGNQLEILKQGLISKKKLAKIAWHDE